MISSAWLRFGARDVARLMGDEAIIRNRLKIEACIENARRILALRDDAGSFARWLDAHHPRPKEQWVRLFRETFRFTGGEIVGEFLMSLGYLPGAHIEACPVHRRILRLDPPWRRALSRSQVMKPLDGAKRRNPGANRKK